MKFVCVRIKSKKTFCILIGLILCLIISSEFTSAFSGTNLTVNTENQRYEFLRELGIQPQSETVKSAVIPESFSADFKKYNDLQLEAGFDLSNFCGLEAYLYEYPWNRNGKEYLVHLIVYERKIIGGDISENRLNGEILPLKSVR